MDVKPLLSLVGKDNISDLLPIVRSSRDCCFYGPKGSMKTLTLTFYIIHFYKKGYQVLCNYPIVGLPNVHVLGWKKPILVSSLKDFDVLDVMDCKFIFVCDDAERWISSKFLSRDEKRDILEVTTNFGKYGKGCDFYWSTKEPLEADKTVRRTSDTYIKCFSLLKYMPNNLDEFLFMREFLDFYMAHLEVYFDDDLSKPDMTIDIDNVEKVAKFYDTRYKIKDLPTMKTLKKGVSAIYGRRAIHPSFG